MKTTLVAAILATLLIHSACQRTMCDRAVPVTAPDTSIVFQLDVDPALVDSVMLVGEFTNWDRHPAGMAFNETLHMWTKAVSLRRDQVFCAYRFMIHRSDTDSWHSIADPRARLIDASLGRNSVVMLREQGMAFSPFAPPPLQDLVVYEINPREFVRPDVPYANVATDLDAAGFGKVFCEITRSIEAGYFTELGINAIELMPILATVWTDFERTGFEREPWGYNCISWFGLNGDFGTPDDLKAVVEAAHRHDIAVLLDFSLGHGSGQIIAQIHLDWLNKGANPWGMIEFNMAVEGGREYMLESLRMWTEEYHVDGFRMDWIDQYREDQVPWHEGGTWAWFTERLKEMKPDLLLIAENPTPEIVRHTRFDSCWDFFFAEWCSAILLREQYSYYDGYVGSMVSSQSKLEENLTAYVYAPWGPHKPIMRFTESHDTPRVARSTVIAQHGGGRHGWLDVNGDGQTPDSLFNGSQAKSRLGATLLFTTPGPIMLFQGQEFGAEDELGWEYDPLDWGLRESNDSLVHFYRRLVSLRKDHESLRSEDLTVLKNDIEKHIFVYARGVDKDNTSDDDIVVALNFAADHNGLQDVSIPFPKSGAWVEYLSGDTLQVGADLRTDIDFGYSEGKVLVHQP